MKVRITNNKIRYRVKQHEVQLFKEKGFITETLALGDESDDQIGFSLKRADDEVYSIEYNQCHITIQVPAHVSVEWVDTEMVGFEQKIKTSKGKEVYILVEKDFACMDGREEDNEDTYPNPLAANSMN